MYVADTGVDAMHPELNGRVADGFCPVSGERPTTDAGGHGTHVAGVVASQAYGVAKAATVVPVKVFRDASKVASMADMIEGVNWVMARRAQHKRPTVLSMSLGAESGYYAGEKALQKAEQAGVVVVAAAGNGGGSACEVWACGVWGCGAVCHPRLSPGDGAWGRGAL